LQLTNSRALMLHFTSVMGTLPTAATKII